MNINTILRRPCNNASSERGASMGRRNLIDENPCTLHLQRLKMVDGDYDTGGAYWGGGTPGMWCAFNEDADTPTYIFVRGYDREDAKEKVFGLLSTKWSFYR